VVAYTRHRDLGGIRAGEREMKPGSFLRHILETKDSGHCTELATTRFCLPHLLISLGLLGAEEERRIEFEDYDSERRSTPFLANRGSTQPPPVF
jgi:hypothetical protein